ncbi:MAG TPA: hypothetical protein VFK44_09270 [Bacillales bacterium]|nr:hypothetical protein [Bacillales bacterium]
MLKSNDWKVLVPVFMILAVLLFSGCSERPAGSNQTQSTHNPTAQEILSENPGADLIQVKGIVYKNASDIDGVKNKHWTVGKKVDTVTGHLEKGESFADGMATKLPIGTSIYEPNEKSGPILIVVVHGNLVPYLGMVEG